FRGAGTFACRVETRLAPPSCAGQREWGGPHRRGRELPLSSGRAVLVDWLSGDSVLPRVRLCTVRAAAALRRGLHSPPSQPRRFTHGEVLEIGRASCRERVE